MDWRGHVEEVVGWDRCDGEEEVVWRERRGDVEDAYSELNCGVKWKR